MKLEVYKKLVTIGCCKLCCLRLCGETDSDVFKDYEIKSSLNLNTVCDDDYSNGSTKKLATNACVACLGMLQAPMCHKIINKIVEAVSKEQYDNPTFNIAFTLPVSFYLRAHSLLVFLVNNFQEYFKKNFPLGVVTVGVKDAWKYVFVKEVENKINKKFNNESDLRVQVDIQYEDDHSEIKCLSSMYPNKFKDQKIKTRKLRHLKGPTSLSFSRKCVETVLVLKEREHFAAHYPVPPTIPTHSAVCNNVLFEQGPIYIAGRYNKYVRMLPQTAWLVQNERKLETSVHELIAYRVQSLTKAQGIKLCSQGSKLISSGREDVDVRMLGTGRPFALEVISPRHIMLANYELKTLEDKINYEAVGKISVSCLKVIPKTSMDLLKAGEEFKTKTYAAYCVAWTVDTDQIAALSEHAPLTLQQKTPVRVLHRRPIATRPRTVHWMKVSDMKVSQVDGTTHFKLVLNTQAGTYIKEFVHGDFGRTKPCIGDLLGGITADCLALDVEGIELEWPPGYLPHEQPQDGS